MSIQEAKDYALQQFVQLEKDKALEAERSRMLEGLLLQNRYSNSDETNLVQYLDVVRLINSGVEYSANKDESGLVTCGYKGHMYSHCDCDVLCSRRGVGKMKYLYMATIDGVEELVYEMNIGGDTRYQRIGSIDEYVWPINITSLVPVDIYNPTVDSMISGVPKNEVLGLVTELIYCISDRSEYSDKLIKGVRKHILSKLSEPEEGLVTCKGHMYRHCDCDVPTPLTPVGNDSPFGRGKSQKNRRIQRLRSENHNLRTQIEKLQKKDFASDIETCSGCKKEYAVGPYPHRCKSLKTEQGLKIEQGIVLSDFMKEEIKYLLTKCYYRNAKEEICESQGHVSGHVSKSSIWAERVDRVLEHLGIVEPLVEPTEFGTKVTATLSDNGHKWTAELVRVGGPMLSGRAWLEDGAGSWHWADLINPKLVEK